MILKSNEVSDIKFAIFEKKTCFLEDKIPSVHILFSVGSKDKREYKEVQTVNK